MPAYLKELDGADVTAIQLIEIVRGGTGKKAKQFENISTYGACKCRPKHLMERLGTSGADDWDILLVCNALIHFSVISPPAFRVFHTNFN
jgi:hypothetical protein